MWTFRDTNWFYHLLFANSNRYKTTGLSCSSLKLMTAISKHPTEFHSECYSPSPDTTAQTKLHCNVEQYVIPIRHWKTKFIWRYWVSIWWRLTLYGWTLVFLMLFQTMVFIKRSFWLNTPSRRWRGTRQRVWFKEQWETLSPGDDCWHLDKPNNSRSSRKDRHRRHQHRNRNYMDLVPLANRHSIYQSHW